MRRTSGYLVAGVLLASLGGCGLCQDCQDHNGPVMESPNFHGFYDGPRMGSAETMPATQVTAAEGETAPANAMPANQAPANEPPPSAAAPRRFQR